MTTRQVIRVTTRQMIGVTMRLVFLIFLLTLSTSVDAQSRGFSDIALPRRNLPVSKIGLNAFVNDPGFGTVSAQLREVRNQLDIRHVRVLFAWTDQVQSSETATPFFGFYDDIARSLPRDVSAVVVLFGLPSWAESLSRGDPLRARSLFVERWVRPLVDRYGRNSRIVGFQIWNEPNNDGVPLNDVLDVTTHPENYVSMLQEAHSVIKARAPGKKVVPASTTSIIQNYPDTLYYNRKLIDGGLLTVSDIFTVHWYGSNLLNYLLPGRARDFLNDIPIPIWMTESGQKGLGEQENYVRRYWPYLFNQHPNLSRIYYYQFTERTESRNTYGLKNGRGISSLYGYLQSRRRRR